MFFAVEFDCVNSCISLIPSEISVKLMLVTLGNNMAPQTYTAKITEDRKPSNVLCLQSQFCENLVL